jgi:uncharacterized protein (TIGR02466 family)
MERSIHLMFPTPIMKTKFPRDFTPEELTIVYTEKIANSVGNKSSKDRRILENPAMWELKQFAQECLDEWVKTIVCPKDEGSVRLQITQSWLNYTNPNEYHHSHYHPNSIVSGVIYILADRIKDEIEFLDDSPRQWHIHNATANEFNSNQYHVPIHTGDCVLFPSLQYHGVPEVQGQTKRISLAFNSFWKGRIGFPDDATNYLEINDIK